MVRRKRGTDVYRPQSSEHPDDESFPGLLILRTEGRIYFANAQRIGDKMAPIVREAQPRVVLLDCGAVPDIEYTALKMLVEAEERLRDLGIQLWLARLNPAALEVVQRSSPGRASGPGADVLQRAPGCRNVPQPEHGACGWLTAIGVRPGSDPGSA